MNSLECRTFDSIFSLSWLHRYQILRNIGNRPSPTRLLTKKRMDLFPGQVNGRTVFIEKWVNTFNWGFPRVIAGYTDDNLVIWYCFDTWCFIGIEDLRDRNRMCCVNKIKFKKNIKHNQDLKDYELTSVLHCPRRRHSYGLWWKRSKSLIGEPSAFTWNS